MIEHDWWNNITVQSCFNILYTAWRIDRGCSRMLRRWRIPCTRQFILATCNANLGEKDIAGFFWISDICKLLCDLQYAQPWPAHWPCSICSLSNSIWPAQPCSNLSTGKNKLCIFTCVDRYQGLISCVVGNDKGFTDHMQVRTQTSIKFKKNLVVRKYGTAMATCRYGPAVKFCLNSCHND